MNLEQFFVLCGCLPSSSHTFSRQCNECGASVCVCCQSAPCALRHRNTARGLSYSMSAGVWLHGEAVAAGTVMAADMSHRLGWIDQELLHRTQNLIERAKLPVAPPQVC